MWHDATARTFGFRLHTRADGTFDREVAYDPAAKTLCGAPLAPVGNRVRMRLLVDRGQLEIFGGDGRFSFTDNVDFDSAPGSQGISLFTEGGTWTAPGAALEARAFYLSSATGADFTYSGDVTPLNGVAAGLVFRANADATQHYTANVDVNGMVKLWRPGHDIAVHPTTITPGRSCRLTVTARGDDIRVAVDGVEVINARQHVPERFVRAQRVPRHGAVPRRQDRLSARL